MGRKATGPTYLTKPWMQAYYGARRRCTDKKYPKYANYGGRGIQFLLTKEEIKELWFRDGASKMKKPSIDREDSDGNYEFGNCRFIEHSINCKKDLYKPVYQIDNTGHIIKLWPSILEAAQTLKCKQQNISRVCSGLRQTHAGFKWRLQDVKM